jgi:glucosamine-phosphate N-acetyltransferase
MIRHIENTDYIKYIKLINININKDVFDIFINNLNKNRHIILVYDENNEILGTGSLLIEAKLTYNISYLGHIENIFINENNRNKGIGKLIVNYLIAYAKDKGCYRIDLTCEDKLKTFYKERGFNKQLVCMSMLVEENFK